MTSAAAPAPSGPTGSAAARRLFTQYLSRRSGGLLLSAGCAVLAAALTAAVGALLNPVISGGLEEGRFDLLTRTVAVILLFGVLRGAAQVGQAAVTNRLGHAMVGELQADLFRRLVRSDLAQLRAAHSGSYLASVLYDAGLIREAATTGLVNYVQQGLTVVFCVGAMLFEDPALTVVVLIGAPLASAAMRRFSRRASRAAQGAMSETSALSTAVMESLDGIKIVKIDNREAFEEARVAEVVARRQRHIVRGANARAAAAPITETLTVFVLGAVLVYAGWRAQGRPHVAGEFASFIVLLMAAAQSLRQVANLQTVFAEGLAAASRLFAALDVQPEIADRPGAPPLRLDEGEVRLEAVRFRYAPDAPALEGVDLVARRGERVALVGPSGGGKSTVLNLIPRFYDVQTGRVSVDGQDVREVALASLRDRIALVAQEPFLFDDTVLANIAYSRPGAPREEVEAAARAADAHDFIQGLPQGYETLVGEAGARLSGGQRQRIAIARAFLKDAPILLLDEATSALDAESEQKVHAALERLMRGRTTLMIAHRLATVRSADRIYVFDRGRVVEVGDHRSLLERGGAYARLAQAQDLDLVGADVDAAGPAAASREPQVPTG